MSVNSSEKFELSWINERVMQKLDLIYHKNFQFIKRN